MNLASLPIPLFFDVLGGEEGPSLRDLRMDWPYVI